MRSKKELNPVTFRYILSGALSLAVIASVATFIVGYGYLKNVALETSKHQADAEASGTNLAGLEVLKKNLEGESETIKALESLTPSGSFLQFDTENSIRAIARQTNIRLKGDVNFVNSPPPTANSGTSPTQSASPNAGQRVTTKPNSRISFEIDGPIPYQDFINFLNAIETSTPKLQLTGLSLTTGDNGRTVQPSVITVELAG